MTPKQDRKYRPNMGGAIVGCIEGLVITGVVALAIYAAYVLWVAR